MNSAIQTQAGGRKPVASRDPFDQTIFRYGLALASVLGATALGFLANEFDLHESVFAIFLLAIALTSWYAGVWPAIVAFVVSAFVFNYYFTPPLRVLTWVEASVDHGATFYVALPKPER